MFIDIWVYFSLSEVDIKNVVCVCMHAYVCAYTHMFNKMNFCASGPKSKWDHIGENIYAL